ncbi:MAG TPA: polysaccharide deacetylase family protein [Jatrophihabitans sp.]|jgi:peptidoglycan/xylan/chitin deacetylase (PgdA/CDA1 family)|uniref:polysaccharide deacetylase family protein n=1 Tax=Jatrophihabitans sp. TaxID=1932789 RepID=UPI002E0C0598|nr:polysaccharide deacetylase family protein [Jatrophihabitans sp.]
MSPAASGGDVARRAVLLSIGGVIAGTALSTMNAAAAAGVAANRATGRRLPPWSERWHAPVRDLEDFLRRDRAARFPARSIMLTIDDGPSPEWTPRYLRLLARHRVTATFCVIGQQVRPNRSLVRAVAAEGHVIANHTWTHDEQLAYRSPDVVHREIARTNEVVHEATGHLPAQFRAPGGVWGPRVFDELAAQHMMPLGWDVDPRDWARPGTGAIEAALGRARPGNILLCHDGGGDRTETYRALQTVIPALLRRGLHFVTLPAARQ